MRRRISAAILAMLTVPGLCFAIESASVPRAGLVVTPKVISALRAFRAEPKFEDRGICRAPTEAIRLEAAAQPRR